MARYRSILSLIIVIVATFLVGCGSPTVETPPTYTVAQVEQIQQYVPKIVALRDRMRDLPALIKKRDWINVSNFIHGPLGELRLQMTYVTRNLLPKDQESARQATRDLFNDLVKIEQAAEKGNSQAAVQNYQAALADINKFLDLVPQPNTEQQA
jgi:photosystem II protein PsbQ